MVAAYNCRLELGSGSYLATPGLIRVLKHVQHDGAEL